MAKDLTAALHALTEAAQGQTSRVDRSLPEAKAASAIPTRSGSSGPIMADSRGNAFVLKGEKTLVSSDGLISLYFPETLEGVVGEKTVTIGAIVAVAP